MKIEKIVAKSTEVGKSKNGLVPTPAPIISHVETRGMVPSPAPNTSSVQQVPPQTTKK